MIIIAMIPHTSATIFSFLAVLEASVAALESPTELALCTLKKQESKLVSIHVQFGFLKKNRLKEWIKKKFGVQEKLPTLEE